MNADLMAKLCNGVDAESTYLRGWEDGRKDAEADRKTRPIPENDTEALEQLLSDTCDELNKVTVEKGTLRHFLELVMWQSENDLKEAHAEICRLQDLDPATHSWPEWSSPAQTLRWFKTIRETTPYLTSTSPTPDHLANLL